jgi:DNA-binding LytR/AlgR family response regulator
MKIVIIEDETLAQKKLAAMIAKYDPSIEVVSLLASVREAINWFQQNEAPDLVFMDIHLEDGLSFAIMDEVSIDAPIIFTTAFDEYTINAFKVNGIDYLLKPINPDDLSRSFDKYESLQRQFGNKTRFEEIIKSFLPKTYKTRFLISEGNTLKKIDVEEVAYFFAENKYCYLITKAGKQYLIDPTLEKLTHLLDPSKFYRVNRQFIISAEAIQSMNRYSANKLRIHLTPETDREIFVSMDKYTDFKSWVDK